MKCWIPFEDGTDCPCLVHRQLQGYTFRSPICRVDNKLRWVNQDCPYTEEQRQAAREVEG